MIALSALRSERGGGGRGGREQGAKNNERFSGNAGPRKGNRAKMATLFFLAGKGRRFKLAMAVNFFLNRLTVFFFLRFRFYRGLFVYLIIYHLNRVVLGDCRF